MNAERNIIPMDQDKHNTLKKMTLDPEYELIQRFDCIRVTRAKNIRALFQSKKKKSRTLINSTNLVSENYFSVYSKFC